MNARLWMCAVALVPGTVFLSCDVAAQATVDPVGGVSPAGEAGVRLQMQDAQWLLRRLKSEDPERYQSLMDLRAKDPEAFRRKILDLTSRKQHGKRFPGCGNSVEEQAVGAARKRFLEAKDDEERGRCREELKKALETAFDARLAWSRKRALCLEKELANFRARITRMAKARSKICAAKMKKLTSSK